MTGEPDSDGNHRHHFGRVSLSFSPFTRVHSRRRQPFSNAANPAQFVLGLDSWLRGPFFDFSRSRWLFAGST